ncbi:MAG TPA: cytochrome ubiquinol oxidase subunit I [Candidatus Obscuribacterales bacterium]
MDDLLIARCQMGMSLAFHIIFACAGIAMPLLMVIAEWLWLRTGQEVYLTLARRWAKGSAILFAVGAVSGTVLSFELGLLWPKFMAFAGPIIGMPFSLEGFAFFTEAIFLGIYLYGWERVRPVTHLASGILVAVSGAFSGLFVVIANGWMNTPTGFRLVNGQAVDVDPVQAMLNPAGLPETLHMLIAAYSATGFVVAGIHAWLLLRDRTNYFHRRAYALALVLGGSMALAQPLSGDLLGRMVATWQPVKLAAMESHFTTQPCAPLIIGGIPDVDSRRTSCGIEIPCGLSLLAFHDPSAVVRGLSDFPRGDWPNVMLVHFAFQIMVLSGSIMAALALWGGLIWLKRRALPDSTLYLRSIMLAAPLGIIATEAGWMVTEVGRQPWVIHGVMRRHEAVTPMPGLVVPFLTFTVLYLFLAGVVIWLLYRQIAHSPYVSGYSAADQGQVS